MKQKTDIVRCRRCGCNIKIDYKIIDNEVIMHIPPRCPTCDGYLFVVEKCGDDNSE